MKLSSSLDVGDGLSCHVGKVPSHLAGIATHGLSIVPPSSVVNAKKRCRPGEQHDENVREVVGPTQHITSMSSECITSCLLHPSRRTGDTAPIRLYIEARRLALTAACWSSAFAAIQECCDCMDNKGRRLVIVVAVDLENSKVVGDGGNNISGGSSETWELVDLLLGERRSLPWLNDVVSWCLASTGMTARSLCTLCGWLLHGGKGVEDGGTPAESKRVTRLRILGLTNNHLFDAQIPPIQENNTDDDDIRSIARTLFIQVMEKCVNLQRLHLNHVGLDDVLWCDVCKLLTPRKTLEHVWAKQNQLQLVLGSDHDSRFTI